MENRTYTIQYSCACDVGLIRKENQDNFICGGVFRPNEKQLFFESGSAAAEGVQLFGVFDGMGGEECGDAAALIAAEEASRFHPDDLNVAELKKFFFRTNQRICRYAEENGVYSMGTTAALLAYSADRVFISNIGDSKIFRVGDGAEQLSVDHLAPAPFGRKRPLSQNLGIPEDLLVIDPYIRELPLTLGEVFVLCSDGLTDMVSTGEIAELAAKHSVETLSERLVERALANGGRDNVTVLSVQAVSPHQTEEQRSSRQHGKNNNQ